MTSRNSAQAGPLPHPARPLVHGRTGSAGKQHCGKWQARRTLRRRSHDPTEPCTGRPAAPPRVPTRTSRESTASRKNWASPESARPNIAHLALSHGGETR